MGKFRYGSANSAFHPSGIGKGVVIHVITWITGVETIMRQSRLHMAAGLVCGLGCSLALSVSHSVACDVMPLN